MAYFKHYIGKLRAPGFFAATLLLLVVLGSATILARFGLEPNQKLDLSPPQLDPRSLSTSTGAISKSVKLTDEILQQPLDQTKPNLLKADRSSELALGLSVDEHSRLKIDPLRRGAMIRYEGEIEP